MKPLLGLAGLVCASCAFEASAVAQPGAPAPSVESSAAWSNCGVDNQGECADRHYGNADKPLAISASIDSLLRPVGRGQLFMKNQLSLRPGFSLAYDIWADTMLEYPLFMALELGYGLEEYSSANLFGGEVTSAFTSNQPYVGASLRMLSDAGAEPLLSYHVRAALGCGFGPIVLRDARDASHDRHWSSAVFGDFGAGFTLRPLGLLIELGYEVSGAREFTPRGSTDTLYLASRGFFLRAAIVLRAP
jgi:hypothetical protein